MNAKGIFEQVIIRGGYDLTAMLARIDEYHIEGKLDDDERDALYAEARAHDTYQVGDKITYNGAHYVCKLANCVWSPDAYPAGWEAQA